MRAMIASGCVPSTMVGRMRCDTADLNAPGSPESSASIRSSSRATVPDALRGYKEIHLRALKLLKIGGTLATFCCSHHVDAGLFQDTVLSAAFDAHRILRRIATYSQSPDHPIIPMIPETEYLKGFAFEVVR